MSKSVPSVSAGALLLGGEGSGKTTLLKRLHALSNPPPSSLLPASSSSPPNALDEILPATIPTIGTNLVNVKWKRSGSGSRNAEETITVREVGGAMAPLWNQYASKEHVILYTIDAANVAQVGSAFCLLMRLLTSLPPSTRLLVIISKTDIDASLSVDELSGITGVPFAHSLISTPPSSQHRGGADRKETQRSTTSFDDLRRPSNTNTESMFIASPSQNNQPTTQSSTTETKESDSALRRLVRNCFKSPKKTALASSSYVTETAEKVETVETGVERCTEVSRIEDPFNVHGRFETIELSFYDLTAHRRVLDWLGEAVLSVT